MKIILPYNFSIDVDEKNYTLKQTYPNKKTGEPESKTHGYYTSLDGAIKQYIKVAAVDEVGDCAITMNEFVQTIKKICDETIREVTKQWLK